MHIFRGENARRAKEPCLANGSQLVCHSHEMPLEDQDLLVDLIRNRYKEERREDILANAQKTFEEYKKGLTSEGTTCGISSLLS